ncbi:MAG: hypothetical protein IJI14_19940 [Anaerolineaceae bacterium]|nr:hypothetical protein [Anaerolineaceae bacterium]
MLVSIPTRLNASFWIVQALVDAKQAAPEEIFPLSQSMIPSEAAESLWMIRKMAGIEDMTLQVENNGPYIYGE